MKNKIIQTNLFFLLIFLISSKVFATTNYVSKTGAHIPPFDSWVNAATNIQAAVDVASVGDIVLVNDGTYYPGKQISVSKNIIVESVNGARKTIVDGNNKYRCFYLYNANPTINGFTITNGYNAVDGGGVFCRNGGIIQNCIINGNSASANGGGVYCVSGGIVQNCKIIGNSALLWGGGVVCDKGGKVQNSDINGNMSGRGGGIFCWAGGIIQNCLINKNIATVRGGGVFCDKNGTILNCTISENSAGRDGGGIYFYFGGTINNCLVKKNSVSGYYCFGGGICCYNGGTVKNCTIIENSASKDSGGGVYCKNGGVVINSILWNNINDNNFASCNINFYNCIENWTNLDNGIITNNPQFISTDNFHLHSSSLCINSGTNEQYVFETFDLDGNSRIMGYTVDMGTYEFVEPIQYPPAPTPMIDDSSIDFGKINWAKIPRSENYVVQEQFGVTQELWSTIYVGTNSSLFIQRLTNAFYRIQAYNNIGTTDWSNVYLSETPPIVIDESEIKNGEIVITPILEKISQATKFVVDEQITGSWSIIYEGTNSIINIQRLTNTYYRARAENNILQSDWSISVFYSNYPINVTSLIAEQLTDGSGYVSIQSKIKDENLDLSDLKVEYSLNNGASWVNGDPFLVSVTQTGQSPSINNSSEYQITNVLPDDSIVTILWDTKSVHNGGGSLSNQRIEQAKIKVTPKNACSQGYFYNSQTFMIDNTTVSNYWIAINHNDTTTTFPNVSLQLNAEGTSPLSMRISRAPDFRNSVWESYSVSKSWQLSPGSDIKTVYAQFKNNKGYISSSQDSIFLDNKDYSNFEGAINVTFLMGRSGSVADEAPVHTVNLTTAAMYKTEISNVEFAQFVSEGGYEDSSYWSTKGWAWQSTNNVVCPLYWNTNNTPNYKYAAYSDSANEPVVGISYYEAEAYAKWADYELPTEAQWEFFAKGGDERHYPWADDFWHTSTQPTYNLCNWKIGFDGYTENGFTSDGAEYARYVTSYSEGKGHLGHYNLSGNVAEWVKDWYNTYPAIEKTDPEGPVSGTERVIRGGSFVHGRDNLTTTRRMHYPPEFRTNWLGMRVAKNDVIPEPVTIYYLLFIIYNLLMIRRKYN